MNNSLAEIDAAGFARELKLLRAEIDSNIGEEDFRHLKKLNGGEESALSLVTPPLLFFQILFLLS